MALVAAVMLYGRFIHHKAIVDSIGIASIPNYYQCLFHYMCTLLYACGLCNTEWILNSIHKKDKSKKVKLDISKITEYDLNCYSNLLPQSKF